MLTLVIMLLQRKRGILKKTLFTLDPEQVMEVRTNIPLYDQRRFDIYDDVSEAVSFNEDGIANKKNE